MEYSNNMQDITYLPQDPRLATKHILDKLLSEIHPLIMKIRNQFQNWCDYENSSKIRDVYTLCLSQIKKCVLNLFEVFKLECNSQIYLQETRQCNLERLSWCVNRLNRIEHYLNKVTNSSKFEDESNDSFNIPVIYFVNWIDHAFEVLGKLAETVYKTDYKQNDALYELWKSEMLEVVSGLHVSIDELLLSAMTLYRYCLPNDQLVVKARCQVVLRETKALLSELIEGDLSTTAMTTEALKLPVMPTNINVMIDVLKDVLYALETNTNTALLSLLVHCFSNSKSPVDILKEHLMEGTNGHCKCLDESSGDIEDCEFVKDFDLYNERLLQIGSFAVSCSSDQQRLVSLRSGLASLEALEPQLVPALAAARGGHCALLVACWRRELRGIRDAVFLIVDPPAFTEKSREMMHHALVATLKGTSYDNTAVCDVINIGCVVHDFFHVYNEMEPLALTYREKLLPLLSDLNKAILECKVVSNLQSSGNDFTYDIKTPTKKEVTLEQLYKRLKLVYSLVSKINSQLQPRDLFDEEVQNVTHTIVKNDQTYLKSPKKTNLSRSLFARTNVRSSTRNFPLSKLTKHLRNNCSQLNFSVELDRLFDLSGGKSESGTVKNKLLEKAREKSVLYLSPIKSRSSMRKIVLNRHLVVDKANEDKIVNAGQRDLLDENESLQLTEVLNEISDTTTIITSSKRGPFFNLTQSNNDTKNILKIKINQTNTPNTQSNNNLTKEVWHIPVSSNEHLTYNDTVITSNMSDVTQPSNVTTQERINDIQLLETKLNSLKSQFETSL